MTQFEYLGPYKLGEMLGRGGMGSVYEAVHVKTGEKVAVKVIAQSVADEMRFRRRFAGEIETLKRLSHKSIVRIIGTGEEEDLLFYSMELVEGEPLQQRLRREKRISWQATIDIAIQVCSALKHAHDIGAFHRDLKPANLILTADGTVKLVDFGIAKLFGFGEQTVAGSVLGTADYMAPEQADGGPTTARTDLYAVGSVMYAMLSGRPPFTGKRLTEVMESLKRDRPVPLEMICPDTPEALIELVHQLLEKRPEDRPPTALAVMKRLQAMRAGLQREQTLSQDAQPTKTGQPKEDQPDDGSLNNLDSDRVDYTRELNDLTGLGTGLGTGLSSEEHTASDKPQTVATGQRDAGAMQANPDEVTVASAHALSDQITNRSTVVPQVPESKPRSTHFQTIESMGKDATIFGGSTDYAPGWIHYLSIAAMIAILGGGVALFAVAVRTPSADSLYERILAADQDGDVLSEQALIKQFINNYPDDVRQDVVLELGAAVELEQYIRQLRTKANRAGGSDQLDPAEQAFLDAMSARGRRPAQAMLQLERWLNVFGHESALGGFSIRKMKLFAKDEIERLRLAQEQTVQLDSRVEALRDRILWGKTNLDSKQQRALLKGIIELYRNKSWASTAVQFAEKELAALPAE